MTSSNEFATGYLLTKLGQATTARFAERLNELGIRPKHFGILFAVDTMPAGPQADFADALGLVPSAIVTMVDDLERLGAVVRTVDPLSRRRRIVELTDRGRELLRDATRIGNEVDQELLAGLSAHERETLQRILESVARDQRIIPGMRPEVTPPPA